MAATESLQEWNRWKGVSAATEQLRRLSKALRFAAVTKDEWVIDELIALCVKNAHRVEAARRAMQEEASDGGD